VCRPGDALVALGRLARLLAARPDTIVAALHDMNARFTRGRLREWLADHLLALWSRSPKYAPIA
jgi:hypothetical protein